MSLTEHGFIKMLLVRLFVILMGILTLALMQCNRLMFQTLWEIMVGAH
ncbi:hypothetical protein M942_04115 [Enterobacter ludwigii]|nr:hypothetical protein M942_04115 [Enterobacter ludwigii]